MQLGNFPQAFTHLSLICAFNLDRALDDQRCNYGTEEIHMAIKIVSNRAAARGLPVVEAANEPAVAVRSLRKVYPGGVEAVKGIDFEVAHGEVFGLLGPNGAGKSTTIGMLTTTIAPTAGSARVSGYDVAKQPLLARSVSSVVFQEAVVDGALSGLANLDLHARLWAVPPERASVRISELVQALGLSALIDRPVASYSGGERRRLEVARALVSTPQVLFLDEPTVGLDPRIRQELLDVIAGLRAREEVTILLTTHYLEEAARLCDRVAIIHRGEIVGLDTPERLLSGLGEEILEFRVAGNAEAALAALRERGVAAGDAFVIGAQVTLPLHGHAATEALAVLDAERLRASDIHSRVPSLDDVYLQLTGGRMDQAA
jgi:ABC-2 type transport system ATP-binding protein